MWDHPAASVSGKRDVIRLARLSDRRGGVLRLTDACRRARPLRYRRPYRGRRLQTGALTGGIDRARTDRYRDGFHRRQREIIRKPANDKSRLPGRHIMIL